MSNTSAVYFPPKTLPSLSVEPTLQEAREFYEFAHREKQKAVDGDGMDWIHFWNKEALQASAWVKMLTDEAPPFAYPEPKTEKQAHECRVDADCNTARAQRNGNPDLAQYWRKQSAMAAEKGAALHASPPAAIAQSPFRIRVSPFFFEDTDASGQCISDADPGL